MIARCINNMLRSLKLNAKFKELMDDSDKRFDAIYHMVKLERETRERYVNGEFNRT